MKKLRSRELLLTTKAAEKWGAESFDSNVNALMLIVSRIDTPEQTDLASEVMDVYRKKQTPTKSSRRKQEENSRPFEFLVYRN